MSFALTNYHAPVSYFYLDSKNADVDFTYVILIFIGLFVYLNLCIFYAYLF